MGLADRAAYFLMGQGRPTKALMCRGMSPERISGGSGPTVDMINVVLLVRFSPPWVETTLTELEKPAEPKK